MNERTASVSAPAAGLTVPHGADVPSLRSRRLPGFRTARPELRQLRKARGLTLEAVAAACSPLRTKTTISAIERGKNDASPADQEAIAALLRVAVDDIFEAAAADVAATWAATVARGGCGTPGCADAACTFSYGDCHCGCGERAGTAKQSDVARSFVRGEPHLFARGHTRKQTLAAREHGEPLRAARLALGLTGQQLARELGYGKGVIIELETIHGYRLAADRCQRIADRLGRPVEELFTSDRCDAELVGQRTRPPTPRHERYDGRHFRENPPNLGKPRSPETRAKISAAKRGILSWDGAGAYMRNCWATGTGPIRALHTKGRATRPIKGSTWQAWGRKWGGNAEPRRGAKRGRTPKFTEEQAAAAVARRRRGETFGEIAARTGLTKSQAEYIWRTRAQDY